LPTHSRCRNRPRCALCAAAQSPRIPRSADAGPPRRRRRVLHPDPAFSRTLDEWRNRCAAAKTLWFSSVRTQHHVSGGSASQARRLFRSAINPTEFRAGLDSSEIGALAMTEATANLTLPFLISGQAQKHVTVNESLLRLDALVQLAVV